MENLNKIYEYLLLDDMYDVEEYIFEIIPELKYEKNFDQKNEWHIYDVWDHTIEAIKACDNNVEDRLVLLLHDIGKPFSYQNDGNIRHFKNHSKKSAEIARIVLKRLNVPEDNAFTILELIENHSSKINIEDINSSNIDFYKRLLKIQYCDAHGYEEIHSKMIIDELNNTKRYIKQLHL